MTCLAKKIKMMRLTVFLLFISTLQSFAADIGITGTVKDQSGKPLPGVTVAIKGASTGATFTGSAGNYSIQVPGRQSVLQFSFIGYVTKEVLVGAQTVINVTLEDSTLQMTGVVVTALGIKKASEKPRLFSNVSKHK